MALQALSGHFVRGHSDEIVIAFGDFILAGLLGDQELGHHVTTVLVVLAGDVGPAGVCLHG